MPEKLTVMKKVHFANAKRGRRQIKPGPKRIKDTPSGRVPRIARLMALAIKFEKMIADGLVRDQAELAALGYVSRARVTQIMNLLYLDPYIQDAILHLPLVTSGKDPIPERDLRPIAAESDWRKQRKLVAALGIRPNGGTRE